MAIVGKDQLVHEVAKRSELGVADARRALEEIFRAIETELGKGNEVRLTGFGKFSVSRRKAREGRNPQTGEPMKIAAKKVPHFSAGAELKKAVPPASQEGTKSKSKPAVETSKKRASAASKTKQASDVKNEEDEAGRVEEETSQNERRRAKGTRRRPKTPRKPTMRKRLAAPGHEEAPDSNGADEGESAETSAAGKAGSVAASGAKFVLVAAAGLAAGVAGGLAVVHRR